MKGLTQLFTTTSTSDSTANRSAIQETMPPVAVEKDRNGNQASHPLTLAPEAYRHLEAYEAKLQLVRDYTRGVALGYSSGFFLFGAGGISKSYTVLGELERLRVPYRLFNSRMSGRGLFDALAQYSDAVHVLEDMERLVNDRDAQGVLRSATWSQRSKEEGRQKRVVTWATAKGVESVTFSGGIVMLSNRPLDDLPELVAIRTRISHLQLVVSDCEIAALMRKVAGMGFRHDQKVMTGEACELVCEFLISQSKSRLCRLDMRMLDNSFRDYLQWREGSSTSDWQTLVSTRLEGQDENQHDAHAEREWDFTLMAEAVASRPDSVQEQQLCWSDATGKSRASFFRCRQVYFKRLREESEQPNGIAAKAS